MKTFYWYFRPLAIFGKVMGVFPLDNILSLNPKNIRYRFFSFTVLYSYIIFSFYVSMIYYFSGFIFSNTSSQMFLHFVVYLILFRSIVCFMFCSSHSKKLPELINLLDQFDKKKDGFLIQQQYNFIISFILKTLGPVFMTTACLYLFFQETGAILRVVFPPETKGAINSKWASHFFGFLSIWQVIPQLQYVYFSTVIIADFCNINCTLKSKGYIGNYFCDVKYDSEMHETLEKARYLHNMLSECVSQLGNCYGSFMAVDRLSIITMFVVNISAFLQEERHNGHLLFLTILNAYIVLNVILISDAVNQRGMEIVNFLHGIPTSAIDSKCESEIQLFLIQLTARPIEISAAGYFKMDKGEIASVSFSFEIRKTLE